jgi:hypothetical protein
MTRHEKPPDTLPLSLVKRFLDVVFLSGTNKSLTIPGCCCWFFFFFCMGLVALKLFVQYPVIVITPLSRFSPLVSTLELHPALLI